MPWPGVRTLPEGRTRVEEYNLIDTGSGPVSNQNTLPLRYNLFSLRTGVSVRVLCSFGYEGNGRKGRGERGSLYLEFQKFLCSFFPYSLPSASHAFLLNPNKGLKLHTLVTTRIFWIVSKLIKTTKRCNGGGSWHAYAYLDP